MAVVGDDIWVIQTDVKIGTSYMKKPIGGQPELLSKTKNKTKVVKKKNP